MARLRRASEDKVNFQQTILSLDRYWTKQGCAILPGGASGAINVKAGVSLAGAAGSPASAGYSYQVLLRPAPPSARTLFLGALKTAGINPAEHDLRWLEAGRALFPRGTAGAGWEVLIDGLHLAKFIYMSEEPSLPAAWIDLSLERLALLSQRRARVRDLAWSDDVTYGELHGLCGEER